MKKSFLMMCPLLLSCLAVGSASAEPCDYIVTDNNLQQVAFFDKTPITLCFTTAVDRFVTGSYKGWSVSLEKGNEPKESAKEHIEPAPAAVDQQATGEVEASEPATKVAADEEVAQTTEEHSAGEKAEAAAHVEEDAQQADAHTEEDAQQADAHTEKDAPQADAHAEEDAQQADAHTEEDAPQMAAQVEENAPQVDATDATPGAAVPFQKGSVTLPKNGTLPLTPQSSWVEVEQHAPPEPEESHTEEIAGHPAPAAKAVEAHPSVEKPAAVDHTEEHTPQAAASADSSADGLVPFQKGVVTPSQHAEKPVVPSSRWVEVEQKESPEPAESHPEEMAEHPAPAEEAIEETDAPQVEEQPEQTAAHTEPEIAEQPVEQEEEHEGTADQQPAAPVEEAEETEQEEPVAVAQFPYIDRLLVAPTGKQSRDTLLFAYVDGKMVPIIIQLKNNME